MQTSATLLKWQRIDIRVASSRQSVQRFTFQLKSQYEKHFMRGINAAYVSLTAR